MWWYKHVNSGHVFMNSDVAEKWIEQNLNNFDPQDERTWKMRYLENSRYLQDGGPIFIYVGGESTVSESRLTSGHMHDMARDLNGTMFRTEHRFYGKSRPTEDLTVDSLRFLNVDQALVDLAHFIVHIKSTNPELKNSGVILVGSSYAGSLVTWFMQKYPLLANGVWASSAPLEAKINMTESDTVASKAFEFFDGKKCSKIIKFGFQELESQIETENIKNLFKLCHPIDPKNQLDIYSLFEVVTDSLTAMVQSGFNEIIKVECSRAVNRNVSNLENLAYFWHRTAFGLSEEDFDNCYDHRCSNLLAIMNPTSWNE